MARPPLANLTLTDLPQLAHGRRLPCHNTLHHLHSPADHSLARNLVCSSLGLDFDDANSWITLATVMCAVTKITEPGLQSRGIVFLDGGAVCEDAGLAGDGGPFASAVEEGDVDGAVGGDVVGFAGFGVGVEDQVDATGFL